VHSPQARHHFFQSWGRAVAHCDVSSDQDRDLPRDGDGAAATTGGGGGGSPRSRYLRAVVDAQRAQQRARDASRAQRCGGGGAAAGGGGGGGGARNGLGGNQGVSVRSLGVAASALPWPLLQRRRGTPSVISLDGLGVGDVAMLALVGVLSELPHVCELRLRDCRLSDVSLVPACRAVAALPRLVALDLSCNDMDDAAGMLYEYLARSYLIIPC